LTWTARFRGTDPGQSADGEVPGLRHDRDVWVEGEVWVQRGETFTFRCLKGIDLLVSLIHHLIADRVRSHILLCLLAYYVE
jgi:hypothetical protein